MAENLSQAVCENLLAKPTTQFSAKALAKLHKCASLSLVLLSNKAIRALNKRFRSKDIETDVLSFTLNLIEPKRGVPWELGEIFISVEKANTQAQLFNHSLKRELAFLFVHGMLHILGFDHENKRDERIMLARQKAILTLAGYSRR